MTHSHSDILHQTYCIRHTALKFTHTHTHTHTYTYVKYAVNIQMAHRKFANKKYPTERPKVDGFAVPLLTFDLANFDLSLDDSGRVAAQPPRDREPPGGLRPHPDRPRGPPARLRGARPRDGGRGRPGLCLQAQVMWEVKNSLSPETLQKILQSVIYIFMYS